MYAEQGRLCENHRLNASTFTAIAKTWNTVNVTICAIMFPSCVFICRVSSSFDLFPFLKLVSGRFFGNRSYCYHCLEKYPQALADAERSIQLAPDWPKGHFRQGSALMGMKVGQLL